MPTNPGQLPTAEHAKDSRVPAVWAWRAFTMLEIMVVVVILGVLASVTIPRLLNVGQRQAEQEARAVQQMLSIVADKCDVWRQPVAVDFVADKGILRVWTRRDDSKAGDDATGAARVKWQADPLVEPVVLERLKLSQAIQDSVVLPQDKWRVTFIPGQPRPGLSIQLAPKSDRDGPRWTVSLSPDQSAAIRVAGADAPLSGAAAGTATQSRTIDLDDAGKGQSKW